jgi:hypothetical protein
MLTLADLLTPETRDEVLQDFLDIGTAVGLPVTAWQKLGVARTILATVAQKVSDVIRMVTTATAGGLLDYAAAVTPEGGPGWLDILGHNMYGTDRIPGTFAGGAETLTNTSGVTYTIDPGDLTFSNTLSGKTYTNLTGGPLNAHGSLTVDIIASEIGSASSSIAGAIDNLVTPLNGVTCANALPVLGTDVQKNADYVLSCRASLAATSPNGAHDAYNYFAKRTLRPDGSSVGVTRTRTTIDPTTGRISLYVASANGPIDPSDQNYVVDQIQNTCVPFGDAVDVINATAHSITVTGVITVLGTSVVGVTDAQLAAKALTQIAAYFSVVPIGGYLGTIYAEGIRGQISQSIGSPAFVTCSISSPAGDTSLTSSDVPTLNVASAFTIVRI